MTKNKKIAVIVLWVIFGLSLLTLAIFCPIAVVKKLDGDKVIMPVVVSVVIVALMSVAGIIGIVNFKQSGFFSSQNITKLAVFTALSYLLYMFVKFPLPFIFPSFLDVQISDVPALLAGFMMGPIGGVIVVSLKILLKLPFSSTGMVGELGDFLMGLAFVLPASIVYRYHRSKKGALIGLLSGALCCIGVALLVNRFILIPFYAKIFDGGMQAIAGMMSSLYKNITVDTVYKYYLWLAVLPFNIMRCGLCCLITFFMYKSLSRFFNKYIPVSDKKKDLPSEQTDEPADN